MTTILQLSDTHFGTETGAVVDALEAHVQACNADLLILSGDVTQRGRRGQFARARSFIDRLLDLGVPACLCIPGNHDIPLFNLPLRFLAPYANYRHHMGEELEPVFENSELLVIGLNTTHPRRHKDGRITPVQISQVSQRLQNSHPDKLRIVVAHQPFGLMEPSDRYNLQHNAARALHCWADQGLDIVMGGHIHLPYVLPLSPQYPGLSREIWTVQAGTALSKRLRGLSPNSFNRLQLKRTAQGKQVQVERWDFRQDSFFPAACFTLQWPAASQISRSV